MAGQDETTGTATVVIEPGTQPLYVVLSSLESTIWRFEGATARVRQVALVGVRAQGVTGLAGDKVSDQTLAVGSLFDARCFRPFWDTQSPEGLAARGAVARTVGKPVDVMGGQYEVGSVSLPSGSVQPTPPNDQVPDGLDPIVYEMGLRFSPAGLIDVDPNSIVPAGLAEPYVVFPGEFGLAQLVGMGKVELREQTSFFATFYIAQPIPRFPAGLYGAHGVRFVLGTGVPLPPGDPGHSCVLSEETGLPLANATLCELLG
jgi:hypothetical protein